MEDQKPSALLGGFSLCLRSLEFQGDPAFQNCAEFISVTVGVIGAIILGFDVSSVLLKGDSVTALTWAEDGRFKSDNVTNAATVFTMVCATKGFHVVGTELVTSADNWMCDGLSRREPSEPWGQLMERTFKNHSDCRIPQEITLDGMEEVLNLCDPRLEWDNDDSFAVYWRRVYELVIRL